MDVFRLILRLRSAAENRSYFHPLLTEAADALAALDANNHPDNLAVDRFAFAMKQRLAEKRQEGRSGWDQPAECSERYLAERLVDASFRGSYIGVANFAMFLHERGASREVLAREMRRSTS